MELIKMNPMPKAHRVFVLEDDLELSTVIEKVFKSIDSHLILDWATSVEAAVDTLEQFMTIDSDAPYDLIVADIFLDGRSTGIDFWRTCQEWFPETPILITSALSLDKFFATVGMHSISPPYLQKPFSPSECKQVFESMLRYSTREKWETRRKHRWMI